MKKTSILIIVLAIIVIAGLLYNSIYTGTTNEDKFNFNNISNKFKLYNVYIDDVTCVEYLYHQNNNSSSITPRLDKDGKVKLNKECLER